LHYIRNRQAAGDSRSSQQFFIAILRYAKGMILWMPLHHASSPFSLR
jgi:hypothetical protein